jgi:hypothetical protein
MNAAGLTVRFFFLVTLGPNDAQVGMTTVRAARLPERAAQAHQLDP